ncbi:MAG TPA: ATP-dependent Clp protease adaptor ClpS [Fimbriimonadaceae bacterium]|nr:ATP-dependent Clp protease adaptor ClpS [Fimbriimonadaceae bacterium]
MDPRAGGGHGGWIVTVYNNDYNTYDQVVSILIAATSCTPDEAHIETWEIDHLGKSVVHHGSLEECTNVADVISTIGIRVEVSQEG